MLTFSFCYIVLLSLFAIVNIINGTCCLAACEKKKGKRLLMIGEKRCDTVVPVSFESIFSWFLSNYAGFYSCADPFADRNVFWRSVRIVRGFHIQANSNYAGSTVTSWNSLLSLFVLKNHQGSSRALPCETTTGKCLVQQSIRSGIRGWIESIIRTESEEDRRLISYFHSRLQGISCPCQSEMSPGCNALQVCPV